MTGHPSPDAREAVGAVWTRAGQQAAQARGWEALRRAAAMIEPGMDDRDGLALVDEVIRASGAARLWHASQVRFGPNTALTFGKVPDRPHVLAPGDAFFLDIGPVYNGFEADVGSTFTLGGDGPGEALAADGRAVWEAVAGRWRAHRETGESLYRFAESEARRRGRRMTLTGAGGHRIGDFPHGIHFKGKLTDYDAVPTPDLWILEIQLIDDTSGTGAFHEDLLG
jgi:Xaa-Pro aminopeptidase